MRDDIPTFTAVASVIGGQLMTEAWYVHTVATVEHHPDEASARKSATEWVNRGYHVTITHVMAYAGKFPPLTIGASDE